jgi:hypothetical protein
MTELSSIKSYINELKLIRYVKPSHIKNGEAIDETFQLREDRSPPEEYISFFHSPSESIENKIQDVLSALIARKFLIKKTCGFLYLNASQASEEINLTNEIVRFAECGYPHYGMYYLSEDIIDITEAKAILIHHAELHMHEHYSKQISVATESVKLLCK